MRVVESVLTCLFWALGSISLRAFWSSRFLILCSMKCLTSALHSAGFCFILSLSSRGMRMVMVADMSVFTVTQFVTRFYKRCCLTILLTYL